MDEIPRQKSSQPSASNSTISHPNDLDTEAYFSGVDLNDIVDTTIDLESDEDQNVSRFSRSFGKMDIHEFNNTEDDEDGGAIENSSGKSRHRTLPHPLETSGLRGLRNVGNTCFMNCILQCLSNTTPLLDFILSNTTYALNTHGSSMKGELFMTFASLIRRLWDPTHGYDANTTQLKDKIQKFCPMFRGACQHDAQELLRFLLEGIHNDLNRVSKKPQNAEPSYPIGISDLEKSKIAWNWNLRYDNSPISDIFVGQLKSSLTCITCGYRSITYDPFWDLSASIPPSTVKGMPVSLEDCLNHFTLKETLRGNEIPYCENCKRQVSATKQFTIQYFPDVLVIHLKRFTSDERGKLRTVVQFPFTNLDLGVYSDESVSNCSYNLFGVVNHCGTAFSGHYTAYVKHPYSQEWHEYDDSRVSNCNREDVRDIEAYLLFYELSSASKSVMER